MNWHFVKVSIRELHIWTPSSEIWAPCHTLIYLCLVTSDQQACVGCRPHMLTHCFFSTRAKYRSWYWHQVSFGIYNTTGVLNYFCWWAIKGQRQLKDRCLRAKWTPFPYVLLCCLKLTKIQTRMDGGPDLAHRPPFEKACNTTWLPELLL